MNLKQIRKEQKMTQTEVANKLNIDYTTLGRYENGISEPNLTTLIKLANIYHTTIDNLLGHKVPYLLDKSILSKEQNNLIEKIISLDKEQCMLVDAYIEGLKVGKKRQEDTIKKLKGITNNEN